jgi:predicted Zn-dependent peptidase
VERLNQEIVQEEAKGTEIDQRRLAELKKKFEALELEGRKWVIQNELGDIYDRNGGVGFNASTGRDVTSYTISLPSNRFPLWMAIESDRTANPVLREFYKEREVVLEERRRSVETNPSGQLYETFLSAAFVAHPYGYPTLGWPSDVRSLSATRTAQFFKTYYSPNNTVIAMVGDFRAKEVIPLLEKYFGGIPSGPATPQVVTVEPPQLGERRVEVEEEANPQLVIGFHKPNLYHPDDAVFDVIDSLLSMGRTSRLYKKLVEEKKIAVSVSSSSGTPGAQYPNLFTLSATPRAPHTTLEVEEAIYAELERLKTEPPTEKEMQKIITNIDAALIRSLRSNSGLAGQLAYFEAVAGEWRYVLKNREAVGKVTAEDVMRVAQTTFTKRNRTVATLVKKEVPATAATENTPKTVPVGKEESR